MCISRYWYKLLNLEKLIRINFINVIELWLLKNIILLFRKMIFSDVN